MRIGDIVRLEADSPLRQQLTPAADEVAWVIDNHQDDDGAHRRQSVPTNSMGGALVGGGVPR